MDYQTRAALKLARTPLHPLFRMLHRKLSRYMDLAENWNNGDEMVNGEAWLVRQVAPHLRVAFDVGANLGRWTRAVLEANPKALVYAFEPSPKTCENLLANCQGLSRAKVFQLGLGQNEGRLAFHDYGANSGLSSFVSRKGSVGLAPDQVIQTEVKTFDAFCAEAGVESVDFVKIDTEGYEMAVLRGMNDALRNRRVAMVQFEYGGTWLDSGETLARANELLRSYGYELYKLRQASLEKIDYDCRQHECFKYANFVTVASPDVARQWGVRLWGGSAS
jgi:FkbM family methyltransferase